MPGTILKVRKRKIGELKELGWGSLLGFSDRELLLRYLII